MSINPNLFTCLTCQIAFHAAENQRDHYRTDWHRYNLKRKVAELPPLSADAFAAKVLAQRDQAEANQIQKQTTLECLPCRKLFQTENSLNNHINSRKHKEGLIAYEQRSEKSTQSDTVKVHEPQSKVDQDADDELDEEARILKYVDEKIAKAKRLTELECIFCTHESKDFESNLAHMGEAHTFFIPDVEYLIDLRGLIKYLGEKVSVANVCLYCNGKGRELKSLEAVRTHMADKGHTKIAYDQEIDIMEVSDFYDFRSSYEDFEQGEEDQDLSTKPAVSRLAVLDEAGLELTLPSGNRIGHRSMAKFYKQNLRPIDEQEARAVQRLIEHQARAHGPKAQQQPQYESRGRRLYLTQGGKEEQLAGKYAFRSQRNQEHYRTRVGVNANKLQRYFREQIL